MEAMTGWSGSIRRSARTISGRRRYLPRCGLDKQIGCPDLLILFTSTVSHKMIRSVLDGIDEARTSVVRCHTSSKSALTEILENHSV